jgi:hypothetical protein
MNKTSSHQSIIYPHNVLNLYNILFQKKKQKKNHDMDI